MEELLIRLQHLENQNQAQARTIEQLTARGLFGFFQRRRLQKARRYSDIAQYLKEDDLRNDNIRLKQRILRLQQELEAVGG